MSNLSKEQIKELRDLMMTKRDKALAEYNRCEGAVRVLITLASTTIIEEEEADNGKETPDVGDKVPDSGGESEG